MRIRGFEWVAAYAGASLTLPERKTQYSAGYDLAAAAETICLPNTVTLVPTGLKAYMQDNEYLGLHIRSSLAVKKQLMLANGQGIIDADYYNNADNEGHIMVAVFNFGQQPVVLPVGERIAQGIFYTYLTTDNDAAHSGTRTGGFGSTGS